MTDKQHRAVLHELTQKAHALLREEGVAHRQGLVDHENIGVNMRDHGKGQPHQHAAGVGFDRLVDELADVGEGLDIGKAMRGLRPRQTQDTCIEVDVFSPGELRVETGTQLQQGRHAPRYFHLACSDG